MFPDYQDCARRAAAKQFRAEVESAGFELRSLQPSIGAAIGTAAHLGIRRMLEYFKETGDDPKYDIGLNEALEGFAKEIANGVEWDATTNQVMVAHEQIENIVREFAWYGLWRRVSPGIIEETLIAKDTGRGLELSGHPDNLAGGILFDWKSGIRDRAYHSQMGALSLLAESNDIEVNDIQVFHIKRTARTKTQKELVVEHYDVDVCREAALNVIDRVVEDYSSFAISGDPWAFNANPASMMCTQKYCEAWGTKFCKLWREK
jgi:hypothetical protein